MNFNEYCKKEYETYVKTPKKYNNFNAYYDDMKFYLKNKYELMNFIETMRISLMIDNLS